MYVLVFFVANVRTYKSFHGHERVFASDIVHFFVSNNRGINNIEAKSRKPRRDLQLSAENGEIVNKVDIGLTFLGLILKSICRGIYV